MPTANAVFDELNVKKLFGTPQQIRKNLIHDVTTGAQQ